ncbi:EI24 domain-containing protein [Kitasatospora phosalacinea]|uniref:EI24 domain-containing protein n=1 Tax=Kitasatospora phosalacinea TaxID=2065 RepID=UPI0005254133|nr:EI24 domain-containing protein [Kitasatospora phosalacinea]
MRDFGAGLRFLFSGQRWVARHVRWWAFGMIPALIALVGYVAALAVLVVYAGDLAEWATPFADGWSEVWRNAVRVVVAGVAIGAGGLLAMLTFTAVTLLIGEPFYESLSAKVEATEGGGPPEPDVPLWRALWVAARDSLAVLLRAVAFGIVLFLCGFIPVVGQTVVPVLALCVSGYYLTAELTGTPLQNRGLPQKERLRLLRSRMPMTLGFGTGLALLFLIPGATVLAMPGAVAGATLLAREISPYGAEEAGGGEGDDEGNGDGDGPEPDPYQQPNPYRQDPYGRYPGQHPGPNPYATDPKAG